MNFANLTQHFAGTASCKALLRLLADPSDRHITLQGLQGSGAPMALATAAGKGGLYLIILDDEDQAGYFYSDLSTLLDERRVLYLPSGYKRAVKYGHRDEASAILRTEVLSRLITQADTLGLDSSRWNNVARLLPQGHHTVSYVNNVLDTYQYYSRVYR